MTLKSFSAWATSQTHSAECVYPVLSGENKGTCCVVANPGSREYAAAM